MIKFGTDGWRAVMAEDFTFENVKKVAQAIADYLKAISSEPKRVVIGYDARFLSKDFARAVAFVLAANRIKVVLSDRIVPTPVVSLHALYRRYDLGIMITASHNPAGFNGLKIKTNDGAAADKALTDKIESLLYKNKVKEASEDEAIKSGLLKIEDLTRLYINFLRSFVNTEEIKKLNLKILVDTMYGAGDSYIEKVLAGPGIKFDYLHNQINPSFGGLRPEPIEENLKEMTKIMKTGKYDLGIVLDGDADRLALFDAKGNYINAQLILPLLSIHMLNNRKEQGGIGKTVVGSNLIDALALDLGVPCYETPVGFKYISKLFKEDLICIGGEEAGGIGFKGYIPERDGSAASLLLLEMLAYEKKDFMALLQSLYRRYGRWFYSRIALPLKGMKKNLNEIKLPSSLLKKKVERINNLDGVKLITSDSWLMLRQSGTEPIVRIYAEARTKKEAEALILLGKEIISQL